MYGCENWTIKEGWALRLMLSTVVLEKPLGIPLDCKKIKPVNPKGNQPWIFIGRTDAKAEAPVLWPPDSKSQLIGKDSDAGKNWGQGEKGTAEDEMFEWHHRFNGDEFEQTSWHSEGQGSLAFCSPWGLKDWVTEPQQKVGNQWESLVCARYFQSYVLERLVWQQYWEWIEERRTEMEKC